MRGFKRGDVDQRMEPAWQTTPRASRNKKIKKQQKTEDGVDQRQLEDLIAPLRRPARLPPSQICISI